MKLQSALHGTPIPKDAVDSVGGLAPITNRTDTIAQGDILETNIVQPSKGFDRFTVALRRKDSQIMRSSRQLNPLPTEPKLRASERNTTISKKSYAHAPITTETFSSANDKFDNVMGAAPNWPRPEPGFTGLGFRRWIDRNGCDFNEVSTSRDCNAYLVGFQTRSSAVCRNAPRLLTQLAARHVRERAHLVRPSHRIRFAHMAGVHLIDTGDTQEPHIDRQLFFEDFQHAHDSGVGAGG